MMWHKFSFKKKKYLSLLSTAFLLVGLVSAIILTQSSQEIRKKASTNIYTPASLSLVPGNINKSVGDIFSVSVMLTTGDDSVSGVKLHLTYDSQKLEAQNIVPEQFLPVILKAGQAGGGNVTLTVGSQPNQAQKGSGALASISFKILSSGTAQINFAPDTKVAAVGKSSNALGSSIGATVNISDAANPPTIPANTSTATITNAPYNLTLTPYPRTFCTQMQASIGKNIGESQWNTVQQYDLNSDGIINGLDVLKCINSSNPK